MRLIITTLVLLMQSSHLAAVELFGLDLINSGQQVLRDAAKKAGVKLIHESDELLWFDSYDSSDVLPGSSRLYLGFVRADKRFAFAEYEFIGFKHDQMLSRLNEKYGPGKINTGKFISDREYRWQQDGIQITFKIDWQNYRTRLSYISPAALERLQREQFDARREQVQAELAEVSSAY